MSRLTSWCGPWFCSSLRALHTQAGTWKLSINFKIVQVGCTWVRLDMLPSNGSEVDCWYSVNRLPNAAGLSITPPQVLMYCWIFVQANKNLVMLDLNFCSVSAAWNSLWCWSLKNLNLPCSPNALASHGQHGFTFHNDWLDLGAVAAAHPIRSSSTYKQCVRCGLFITTTLRFCGSQKPASKWLGMAKSGWALLIMILWLMPIE